MLPSNTRNPGSPAHSEVLTVTGTDLTVHTCTPSSKDRKPPHRWLPGRVRRKGAAPGHIPPHGSRMGRQRYRKPTALAQWVTPPERSLRTESNTEEGARDLPLTCPPLGSPSPEGLSQNPEDNLYVLPRPGRWPCLSPWLCRPRRWAAGALGLLRPASSCCAADSGGLPRGFAVASPGFSEDRFPFCQKCVEWRWFRGNSAPLFQVESARPSS